MAFNFASYDAATQLRGGGPTPGAEALMAYCLRRWPYSWNGGIYSPRNVVGGSSPSHHAEGRALDIMIKTIGGGADGPKGLQIVDALAPHGRRLGIDHMIWDRTIWSSRKASGRKYTGKNPHYDHVHIGLTRAAGTSLTGAAILAILGDGGGPAVVVEGATHRVLVSDLRVRAEPSTASRDTVIGLLQVGDEIRRLADAPQPSGDFTFIKVTAPLGGELRDGWVADDERFLDAVSPAKPTAPDTEARGLAHVTHHTQVDNLRLRSKPGTGSPDTVVVEMPRGTALEQLGDAPQPSGDYMWIRVRALVDARVHEGWVANDSRFLKAAD